MICGTCTTPRFDRQRHALHSPTASKTAFIAIFFALAADKVFVSCKGLDREAGVTDSNELNAQAKQAMLRAGRQKILVVDSSKIDKVSFVNITPVSGIEAVVTNARPSEAWLRYLEDQGVRCIYPKD